MCTTRHRRITLNIHMAHFGEIDEVSSRWCRLDLHLISTSRCMLGMKMHTVGSQRSLVRNQLDLKEITHLLCVRLYGPLHREK